MKVLDSTLIKSYLTISSLYITGFELLQHAVIENLKGFICMNPKMTDDGDLIHIENDEYRQIKNKKHPSLNNNRNEFYSCCEWHRDNGAISENDFEDLQRIREHRNKIAHKLPTLLVDDQHKLDLELFDLIYTLLRKIDVYWILNFEVPCNPEYDGKDIKEEDVSSGRLLLMDYLLELVAEEKLNIKTKHSKNS